MYYDTLDPFACLAAAAAVTDRLKLGTGIALVVQRDPIHTAKEVTTIDVLSQGRFLFGIGPGWNLEEMANHGTDPAQRFGLMRERVEAMKAIWAAEEAEYHGDQVDFDPSIQNPKPVQKPHPPILLPLDSQQSFEPMGRMGYRIAIGGGSTHNERGDTVLKEDVERYRRAWRDAGHSGNPAVAIRIATHVAATREEVIRARETVMKASNQTAAAAGRTDYGYSSQNTDNMFGTPEEVVERIHQLEEDFGADAIMCDMVGYFLPRETSLLYTSPRPRDLSTARMPSCA